MQAEAQTLCRIQGNDASPPGILDCNGKRVWCIEQGKEWCFNIKHTYNSVPWDELSTDQECQIGYLMALYQEYQGIGGYSETDFQDAIWTIHTPGYSGSAESAFLVAAAQAYCNGDNTSFNYTIYCNRATLEITTNQNFVYLQDFSSLTPYLELSSLPAGAQLIPRGNTGFMLILETPGTFTLEFEFGLTADCTPQYRELEYCKITNTSIEYWKDIDEADPDAPGCQVLGSVTYNISCQGVTVNNQCSTCQGDFTFTVEQECTNGFWTGHTIVFPNYFNPNILYKLFTQAEVIGGITYTDLNSWTPLLNGNLTISTLENGNVVLVLAELDGNGNVTCVKCIPITLPEITGGPCGPVCEVEAGQNQTLPCTNGVLTTTTTLTGFTPAGGTWTAAGGNPANATISNAGVATGMTVAGNYTFIYTVSPGCSDQVTITVQPCGSCVVDAGPSQALPCTNGVLTTTTTLTGFSPAGGTWTAAVGNPANATITNAGLVTGMTVAGQYTFIYTISPGCSDQATVTVVPCETECDVFAGNDQDICFPQSTTAITDFSPAGGTWTVSPQILQPILPSIDNNGNVTGMTAVGTYYFIYTLGECSDTVAVTVRVCDEECVKPKAGPDVEICQPELKAQLPAAGTGEMWIPGITVPANISGATISQNGMVTFDNNSVTGFFQFILMNEKDKTCADTVWVARNRKVNAGPDSTICEPTSSIVIGSNGLSFEESWQVVPGNPAAVTLSVNGTDVVANGLTVNGTYKFILKGQPDFIYPEVPIELQKYCPDTLCVIRENCCTITVAITDTICVGNGTPDDPSDDIWGFTLTVSNPNNPNGTWTSPNPSIGSGIYGVPKEIIMLTGPITFSITDDTDPQCSEEFKVPPPENCECCLKLTIDSVECDNKGTADPDDDEAVITVTVSCSEGAAWELIRKVDDNGTQKVLIGEYTGDQTITFNVNIKDAVSGFTNQNGFVLWYMIKDDYKCVGDAWIFAPDCDACIKPDAGDDVRLCSPTSTYDLPDAPSGQEWIAAAGNPVVATITATTGQISNMTALGNYKFVLRHLSDPTCADTVSIFIDSKPTPVITPAAASICVGESVVLTASNCVGPVVWSTGATSPSITVSPGTTTSYTVSCQEGECTGDASVTVTVKPQPEITSSGNPVCASDLTTYTVNFTATAGATVTADKGTVSGSSVTGVPSGETVRIIAELDGCSDTLTVTFNCECPVVTPPVPSATPATICVGESSTLSATGCASGTVSWFTNAGLTTSLSNLTVSPTTTTTYYAVCTITASGCASQAAPVTVTVNPLPTPAVNSPAICVGESATLTVTNCAGTVTWNDATTGLIKTVSPAVTTTYTATCLVNGCEGETTATVTVKPQPEITSSGNPVCASDLTTYTVNFTATAGATITANLGTVSGSSVTGIPSGATVQIIADLNGCRDTLLLTHTCVTICIEPTIANSSSTAATCIATVSNTDASITLTGISGGNRYAYATTVGGLAPYSAATPLAGTSLTISNLPNPANPAGQSYVVRIYNGANDCYTDVVVLVPVRVCSEDCVKPDAGEDQLICAPVSSIDLVDANPNEEWISWSMNPAGVSITAQTGVANGMTTNGVYAFILRDVTLGSTCSDTIFIYRGELNLSNSSTCESTFQLPAIVNGSWSVAIGNTASVTPTGTVTGMNLPGPYNFILTNGVCTTTVTIERLDCTQPIYDLSLSKVVSKQVAMLGETITYMIRVTNEGTAPATGVTVRDVLNAGVQYVSSSADAGAYEFSTKTWTIGTVGTGQTVTLTIQVKVIAPGVWFNTAEICTMNEDDTDSEPCNEVETEDDIDRVCFTVPYLLCRGQNNALELTVPSEYTGVVWFRKVQGGQPVQVAMGNSYTASETELGSYEYTFTSTSGTCPAEGCCPVLLVVEDCCPKEICVPFTITKYKK
ncbi:Ig-like domain-containing protein [Arundinibacter roseus]|nr:DUF11 domain-containing protein [Arundinibacter roseus]